MTEQWQELKETITEMRDNDGTGTQQDACKFLVDYMEVLEKQMQQPCEDAVSRTLVHEAITASIAESENPYEMWQRIEALPPVKPKYTDEEIDKAQAVEQAYVDKMVELAVAETKRPKGKWIRVVDKAGHWVWECGCKWQQRIATNYCPDCGSYNGGNDNGDE